MKRITIDGLLFTVHEEVKIFSVVQEKMRKVGQVVKFKRYDVTGDEPVFIDEIEHVVDEDDLAIIQEIYGLYKE